MTIISAQGLRRSQLSKDQFQYGVNTVEEAECMTCDDMPYGNDSQLLAKLDCLLSQLRFLGRSKADVDSRKISHGAAGLNFLLYDIKARGAALFEAVYSEKTSSRDFLPFYSNELFADQHRLNSENFRSYEKDAAANMCGSLMQTHVDPRRIADEYRTCLAAAIPCIKKSSSNEVNETRSPAIKVATGLFTRYLQAGKEEAHRGKVNANTAGSLIQSWRDYAEANLSDISSEELQYTVKLMQDSLKRHFMR